MNKTISKFFVTVLLVFGLALSLVFVGCGGTKEISLDISAVDVVFEVGSEFNSNNLVVYTKNGDTNERVKKNEYTVSAPDMSSAGKKTVTVTYGDITATYEIDVVVKAVVATFTGKVSFGVGGGKVFDYNAEFKCYNTLQWEIVGSSSYGTFGESGIYTLKDGVYTMHMTSGSKVHTTTGSDGKISFDYEGFGIKILSGRMTANGHGTLTLQN